MLQTIYMKLKLNFIFLSSFSSGCRHQFYLSMVQDIQEGRLRIDDKSLAIKLTALTAQSELGDLDSSNQYSAALLAYPKWLPVSLLGLSSLDNSISSPPITRRGKRRKHHSGASEPESSSECEEPSSPFSDLGPSLINSVHMAPGEGSEDLRIEEDPELSQTCNLVMQFHRKLNGLKQSSARYLFLREVSNMDNFGVEYFGVRSNSSPEEIYWLGVGPKGVIVTSENLSEIKHR